MLDLFAPLYKEIMRLRNSFYDKRIFEVHDLGAFTVSVGNITTGGTGKTPLVAHIAEILAARGENVCILTRGYGRHDPNKRVLVSDGDTVLVDATIGGDEPVELAAKLLGKAIVIADADRVSAGEWAKRKFGITAFVLDDGFQHRRVKRDLDIVCIDATQPLFDGKMLPAGRLREPVDSLERADAIVITRSDQVVEIDEMTSKLAAIMTQPSVFRSHTAIKQFFALGNSPDFDASQSVFAFCGLGNPSVFFSQLTTHSVRLVGEETYRDHHRYTQKDVADIEQVARNSNATALITTAKDSVKLRDLKFELPCYVAEIETKIDDEAGFRELILGGMRR